MQLQKIGILRNHALAIEIIQELMEHSTIHPKRDLISPEQTKTMTIEKLHQLSKELLTQLEDYPNICVLQEYIYRMGFFVEDSHAS